MHNQSLTGLNILRFSTDVVISRQIFSCYIPEFPGGWDNAEEPPVISLKKKINFIDISYKKKKLIPIWNFKVQVREGLGGKKSLPHNLVHEAGNRALEREQM